MSGDGKLPTIGTDRGLLKNFQPLALKDTYRSARLLAFMTLFLPTIFGIDTMISAYFSGE